MADDSTADDVPTEDEPAAPSPSSCTACRSPTARASACCTPVARARWSWCAACATTTGTTCASTSPAVDYLTYEADRALPDGVDPERFEVVVTLMSHTERERVRLRIQVPEVEPSVPSLFDVHPGSEAMEREVFDLYGIRFDGHPDLTRILMPEDWVGHPLRKDEAIGRIPVQFKGTADAR